MTQGDGEMTWRPIESAPKEPVSVDGRDRYAQRILVCSPSMIVRVGRWWERGDVGNFLSDSGNAVFPTHWMPLPTPPTEGDGNG
jgi:hypothetical protein